MIRRFSSVRCTACGTILVSTHRHDFQQCQCPQETFVDGGSVYLRIGGQDLRAIEVLVDPEWPTGISLDLLQRGHRLAVELHCRFNPPKDATADDVNHAIAWMAVSLELAHNVDDLVRDALIGAGQWPPIPKAAGPLPAMIRPLPSLSSWPR